jgi:glycosyltransferase involved in cell wall biosynthesis
MKLSIIVPFYNEAKTIEECLKRVKKAKLNPGWQKEIIVINDGSIDSSKFKVQRAKLQFKIKNLKIVSYQKNRGKGYAVRQGLKKATGDYVLIQDADLEYDPVDYLKLLGPLSEKKAQVVYGSRFLGERKSMFFWHMLGNQFLSLMTNILYNSTLSDMEVGYKLFPTKLIKSLQLKENCFGFEPEVTAKILRKGIRIYEVPISYSGREYREGKKITWRDGLKAGWFLLKYRIVG